MGEAEGGAVGEAVGVPRGRYISVALNLPYKWCSSAVWPDWAIYWTLGNFLKPLATINLTKSLTFLGNFCKGVKIIYFSSKNIFGQLL